MIFQRILKKYLPLLGLTGFLATVFASFPALAQSLTVDLGTDATTDGSFAGRLVQIVAMITVLSLAPSILIMATSFTRIIVVFSLLRTAVGIQQTPPNMVLTSLALFMTLFIMMPVFQQSYQQGIVPMIEEEIEEMEAFRRVAIPFKTFMLSQTREKDLQLFADISAEGPFEDAQSIPLHVVVPSFMISELRRAFEIGFLLFLPFLVIDMVTASILMSMGMMMLPPVMISLPFKIIFFVVIDGWYLIVGSLVKSFGEMREILPAAATAVGGG